MRISDWSSDVWSSDLHEFAETDPVKWSTGSSLLAFKGNVREEDFVTVEAVDFAAFLEAMDRPVALLKMDIEGAEVAVLERLLERGLHDRIERSEERRVGKEGVSTCRSRGSPCH